jgi:hypothetical protein
MGRFQMLSGENGHWRGSRVDTGRCEGRVTSVSCVIVAVGLTADSGSLVAAGAVSAGLMAEAAAEGSRDAGLDEQPTDRSRVT